MTDTPERIWARMVMDHDDNEENMTGGCSTRKMQGATEYILKSSSDAEIARLNTVLLAADALITAQKIFADTEEDITFAAWNTRAPVAVKALEWGPYPNPVFAGDDVAVAKLSAFGPMYYQVQRDPWADGYTVVLADTRGGIWESKGYDTLEAAKAAAQADYETRILSALEPGWQPIETAPKDGTRVLLFDGRPQLASWAESSLRGWEWSGGQFGTVLDPTHWHPLTTPDAWDLVCAFYEMEVK